MVALLLLAACDTSASSGPPRAGPDASGDLGNLPLLASGPDALALEEVVGGLDQPVGITNAGDGSGRLFVNERAGKIRVVDADGYVHCIAFPGPNGSTVVRWKPKNDSAPVQF